MTAAVPVPPVRRAFGTGGWLFVLGIVDAAFVVVTLGLVVLVRVLMSTGSSASDPWVLLMILFGFLAMSLSWMLLIVGVVLGILALLRRPRSNTVKAIIGLVLMVASILVMSFYGNAAWVGSTGGVFSG